MRAVVVTGSSTGIGHGTVKMLLERGFRVYGSVRKQADADRLTGEFGANYTPLLFDVTDEAAIVRAAAEVRAAQKGETLAGLVNNAGVAVAGPLLHLPIEEFRRQIEINLTGQLRVTQAFAPLLGADRSLAGKPGRIVMISSVGGRNGSPFLGPYNASKFGLEGLSESLRRELILYGIDVIIIGPGAIATPIWDKADEVDVAPYANTEYAGPLDAVKTYMLGLGRKGLKPEAVGALVADVLTRAHPKVRYAIVPSFLENLMMGLLPKRRLDRIMASRLGLLPKR
ncbi:MAG: SDR family NAD(P)-dependent oxidoreductase [Alphaproteobacteria bacterium]|nr:SDR family NAD(P)-dependent oxidoreductase [Alphaproteobacteria bacterium]